MTTRARSSVFLEEKAECLGKALNFFTDTTSAKSLTEKRVCLLSQITFWEWELDSLIHAFATFKDRKWDWESIDHLKEDLAKNGIMIKKAVITGIRGDRNRPKWWNIAKKDVVAPTAALNKVITLWNQIMEDCQKLMLDSDDCERFGIAQKDLLTLKRPLIE